MSLVTPRNLFLAGISILALVAAGCSKSSSPAASASPPAAAAASAPAASAAGAPVVQTGYYDGHKDTFIDTDVTSKAQAGQTGANYAPTLKVLKISSLPSFFMIRGPAAPGQLTVLGSEPGEADYSPIWREITVRWKPGAKKVLLVKDDQISALAAKGALTVTPTNIAMNCPVTSVGS